MRASVKPRVIIGLALLAASACLQPIGSGEERPLATAFKDASEESGVPERVLLAIGYVETRWHTPEESHGDEHGHGDGGRGLMGVTERADAALLSFGADRLGVDPVAAASDGPTNIRVAAQVLRSLAHDELGEVPALPSAWRPVLARYGAEADPAAGDAYADEVLRVLAEGVSGEAESGEVLVLPGSGGRVPTREREQALDYPGAHWLPARSGHFHTGRGGNAITHVIIHTTEGSYQGAISWFRSANNPYYTSAHYVIRSSDGDITQMVRDQNTAYHIGSWNQRSIGIEHEAVANQGYLWFTDEMYRASAKLTRQLCLKYGIPMTRDRIRGHVEVPGQTHYDPGVHWDWDRYMALVRDPSGDAGGGGGGGGGGGTSALIVDSNNANNDSSKGYVEASSSWAAGYSDGYYGTGYYWASVQPVSDAVAFHFYVPQAASRTIDARWVAGANRSSATPFLIVNAAGQQVGKVKRDQRINGGKWRSLGSFPLTKGWNRVLVSRWAVDGDVVIADAVRVR